MKRNTINIWLAVLSSVTTNALAQTTSIESSTQTLSKQQSQHQQSQLSDSLKQAKEWGLTIEEWNRYTELMKGERGMWSPNLDPLTALGIEARTAEEREKYARMLAKKYYERVSKELDFDKVYRQEFEKLYPNELPFEVEPHISQSIGRVIYFTRFDNCDSCKSDLSKILSYANSQTPLDIYIVGQNISDNDIRKWAAENNIDPIKVSKKLITLNHDKGYWFQYSLGKMPAAYQIKQDGEWQSLVY
ncbi:TPA: TIGR03759 family integrating conjugative element protein [Mannheimia haemolytica]|nr:TIGR03759 family integrating conjugative element protein [Mannheimia haemolytica]HDZ6811895.1 TIGR03759 family integrating conjugative element protein [Mannheimia haemolytica]